MDVIEELKFLGKFTKSTKKYRGGVGSGGGRFGGGVGSGGSGWGRSGWMRMKN